MKLDLLERYSRNSSLATTSVDAGGDVNFRSVTEALKKQLLQSADIVYHRALDRIERATSIGLTKSRRAHATIVDQSRIICEDYIYCRLQGICSRLPPSPNSAEGFAGIDFDSDIDSDTADLDTTLNAVSNEIQHIGAKLELTYPDLYVDLSRHLAMPLRSQVAVRKALVCISDFMFRGQPPVITWCRIVGFFAVAAAIAREVVTNGNAHLIPTIVVTFSELVDCYLAQWIYKQGGWIKVVNEFRVDESKARRRVAVTTLGALIGFTFTWFQLPS